MSPAPIHTGVPMVQTREPKLTSQREVGAKPNLILGCHDPFATLITKEIASLAVSAAAHNDIDAACQDKAQMSLSWLGVIYRRSRTHPENRGSGDAKLTPELLFAAPGESEKQPWDGKVCNILPRYFA